MKKAKPPQLTVLDERPDSRPPSRPPSSRSTSRSRVRFASLLIKTVHCLPFLSLFRVPVSCVYENSRAILYEYVSC